MMRHESPEAVHTHTHTPVFYKSNREKIINRIGKRKQ